MRSLILLCLLCGTSAEPKDLSGKYMAFTYGSHMNLEADDNTHVTIPMAKTVDSATVCLRYLSDRVRDTTLFSMSNSDSYSGVYLEKRWDWRGEPFFQLLINGSIEASFPGSGVKLGKWNSVCVAWDAQKGRSTLYLNGAEGTERESPAESLSGPNVDSPKITLGRRYSLVNFVQEMDVFDGELRDVHVWDSVLSSDDVQKFMNYKTGSVAFTPGNVVSWTALNYQVTGKHFLLREEGQCE